MIIQYNLILFTWNVRSWLCFVEVLDSLILVLFSYIVPNSKVFSPNLLKPSPFTLNFDVPSTSQRHVRASVGILERNFSFMPVSILFVANMPRFKVILVKPHLKTGKQQTSLFSCCGTSRQCSTTTSAQVQNIQSRMPMLNL